MTGIDLIEPQYLALCVFAGFVGLSALIYAIASFGMKEKTYEEAIAEQRARIDKETQQQHEMKQQRKRQFANRRKKDKEKPGKSPRQSPRQKAAQQETTEDEKAFSEEEVPPTPPQNVTPRKEKKKEKPAPVVEKVVEKPKLVQEEIIKPSKAKKAEAAPPPPVASEVTKRIVEEPIMAQKHEQVQAAAPPPPKQPEEQSTPVKSKKAKHAPGPSGDTVDAPMKGKALVNAVRNAQLKPNEIQQMMEALIAKGGGSHDDWVMANQRTDPTTGLKKQLQEKEQALHKEMLLSQSNMQKLKEVKAELVQERSNTRDLEGQYKTKLEQQRQEIEAIHRRMQQTHDQHSIETQELKTRITQMQAIMDQSSLEVVQQLREENNRLKTETNHAQQQKEQIMGAELARLQGEIQKVKGQLAASDNQLRKTEEMRHEYEARIKNYEAKISQMDSTTRENSSSLSKRLTEMTEDLHKSEAQRHSLATELEKSQESLRSSSEELKQLHLQLQDLSKSEEEKKALVAKFEEKEKDAEYQRQGLETKVRAIESQLKDNEKNKEDMIQEIANLKLEKTNLENQLATTEQRPEAEGQEEPAKANGDMNAKDTISLVEHEAAVKEKQDSIDKLQQQITAGSAEVQKLNDQIEQQKKKNDALRKKNWKAMEAVSATERSSNEKLTKSLKELKDELNQTLQEEQKQSKETVQRIFPSIEVNQALAHKEWLKDFEAKAIQLLQEKDAPSQELEELNSKLSSLEADCEKYSSNIESLEMEKAELSKNIAEVQYEKKQLLAQCDHYQSVLGDTEGMLNKLQSSVELEEKKWEEKLASTEKLLQQAKVEVDTLQNELSSLKTKQQTSLDSSFTSPPDLMKSVFDDTSDYQKVVAELSSSKSTIEQLQKDRASVAEELDDVKKQLTQLKEELEAANQRAESSKNAGPEMEQLKQSVVSTTTANEKLTADLETANVTIKDLKGQLENKVDPADLEKELHTTKEALEQTKSQSSKETQSLQEEIAKLKQEEKRLQSEVEKAKTQNGEPVSKDADSKEIQALNKTLEEERKMKKDLGIAAGRLQMMLKKTQALLESERKTSNALRAELGKEPEAEVSSSLTDSQLEEELAEALQESIKIANQASEEASGGTSV